MSLNHSPKVITTGLTFYYDLANSRKSWKGSPVTNLYTNGHFANGNHVTQASGGTLGNPVNEIVLLDNPGDSPYVLRSTSVGGSIYTEYEMMTSAGVIQPNTTYCMTCWYAWTPDWNGTDSIFHSRWFTSAGADAGSTGTVPGTIIETKIINGLKWYRAFLTFTTGADVNGVHSWYAGYSAQNTAGYRYFTNFMLHVGSTPSNFVDGTRSSTQSILDIMGENTITIGGLTYNNDGTFSFDGVDDNITISGDSSSFFTDYSTQKISIETWLKIPSAATWSNGTNYGEIISRGDYAGAHGLWRTTINNEISAYFRQTGATFGAVECKTTITRDEWYHIVITWSGSTLKLYKNGIEVSSNSGVLGTPTVTSWTAGTASAASGNVGNRFQGELSVVKIYNKEISASEVLQNFNALRGRYSI